MVKNMDVLEPYRDFSFAIYQLRRGGLSLKRVTERNSVGAE